MGGNVVGQLGDGTDNDSITPVQVEGLANVTAISAGGWHTVALRNDGTVWVWGSNNFGRLGVSTDNDQHIPIQIHFN